VAAKSEMRHIKASDRDHMQFRMECIKFLSAMTAKIIERRPLKHRFVRFCASLTPATVLLGTATTQKNFGNLAEALYEAHCISSQTADSAKIQFGNLCTAASNELKPLFQNFSPSDIKLDTFYHDVLGSQTD
jgi:hypothetical protein